MSDKLEVPEDIQAKAWAYLLRCKEEGIYDEWESPNDFWDFHAFYEEDAYAKEDDEWAVWIYRTVPEEGSKYRTTATDKCMKIAKERS